MRALFGLLLLTLSLVIAPVSSSVAANSTDHSALLANQDLSVLDIDDLIDVDDNVLSSNPLHSATHHRSAAPHQLPPIAIRPTGSNYRTIRAPPLTVR